MQAASQRLESRLPALDRRFQESKQNDEKREKNDKLQKSTQTNLPPPLSAIVCTSPDINKAISIRQDSNISSDSQTSSPSYTSKTMEAPLLPHKYVKMSGKFCLYF